jgi:hypothetical protein
VNEYLVLVTLKPLYSHRFTVVRIHQFIDGLQSLVFGITPCATLFFLLGALRAKVVLSLEAEIMGIDHVLVDSVSRFDQSTASTARILEIVHWTLGERFAVSLFPNEFRAACRVHCGIRIYHPTQHDGVRKRNLDVGLTIWRV